MWQQIEDIISTANNQAFQIKERQAVTGGDINLAYLIKDEQRRYFAKINQKDFLENFEQEFYSLEQLNLLGMIRCPRPLAHGHSINKSFLILEYLNLSIGLSQQWHQLGVQLAETHKISNHAQYGWQHDNMIGSTKQPNNWQKSWSMFFTQQRIRWQLQLLKDKSIKLGNIEHICNHCHDLLASHHPRPSLLHGDLWLGNVGFVDKEPVIFDPACYYGDRETDLAMTELFGQFPEEFYQGYQATFPLQKHYEKRKPIYNFYHILNHANMFGGVYIDQAKASLQRLLSTKV